jgi:Cupin domain
MTHVGELDENPVTGERGAVRVPPRQSNGHLLVVDLYVRPGRAVAGEHVHPAATETFTVVRGELAVRRDGRELRAGPGTRLRFVELIRQLFLLAQDGRTDARGRPAPLRAAVLGWEFADTIRFTTLPAPLQRLLVGVLYPLARATGHRALDPAYLRREPPTVDLEPLPAEIAEPTPNLSTRPRWPNSTTVWAAR